MYGPALDSIAFLSSGGLGPVRVPVMVMFALYALFYLVLSRTLFGAHLYAVGSNEQSRLAVRLARRAHSHRGVCVGRACWPVWAASCRWRGRARPPPTMGDEFLFPILTTVILGGVSLSGGKGRLFNVLIASIFLVTITNGMVLLDTSVNAQRVASGVILIVALSLDRLRQRER